MSTLMEALFPQGRDALVVTGGEGEVAACLAEMMRDPRAAELAEVQAAAAAGGDDFWPAPDHWLAFYRPYIVSDGVLQIPVKGVLLAGLSYAYGSWATGYPYLHKALERGMADANVRGIAFICDTPGGEVKGNFDLVDAIHARRGQKPMRAFAHDRAYSAGYSIASAADRIVVDRTGGVGSIGVVTSHTDASAALERQGLKITFIYAGKHKVEGNSTEPLSEDARARMQARINVLMDVFVATVARNRAMAEDAVRATEALTYTASKALEVGLADEIGSLADAVAAFAASLNTEPEDETMSISQEAHDAAVAAARTEGETAGKAAGAKAANERFGAILASDQLKGAAVAAAVELAIASPEMSAEAVVTFAAKHTPAAAAGGSRLDGLVPDPNLSHDGGGAPQAEDLWGGAVAARQAEHKAAGF